MPLPDAVGPAGVLRSLAILKEFRPDCVVGLGGYASGPVLLAARLSGRPCDPLDATFIARMEASIG